jgi:dTDP-4-amino-4,6-dideoxygalactose transaminase
MVARAFAPPDDERDENLVARSQFRKARLGRHDFRLADDRYRVAQQRWPGETAVMDATVGRKTEPLSAIADYLRDIERRHPFAYTKINHGLWDALVRVERMRARGITAHEILDAQPWALTGYHGSGFHDELKALVRGLPSMHGDIRFAASAHASPNDDRYDAYPVEAEADVQRIMKEFMGDAPLTADALLWKHAVVEHAFPEFCRILRTRSVVLIGPSWLQHFGAFVGLDRFRFVAIDSQNALLDRERIANEIRTTHDPDDHPVYLIQAGPLSVWLVLTLQPELANATFLDLGLVLDLCSVSRLDQRLWTRPYRTETAAAILEVNPTWPDDPRAYEGNPTESERRAIWLRLTGGIFAQIAAIAGLPERSTGLGNFDRPSLSSSARVRFVEDKPIDWRRVQEILECSRRANRWTNFGPVSQALEQALEFVLQLPPDRAVVVCSSASTGLTALAGLHAVKRGRPLRWLVSAYTFAIQRTGVLSDSIIVDCNDLGLLDLAAVKNLREEQWDGMIVTNLFDALENFDRFVRFCRKRGKALILDSAGAMLGLDRRAAAMPAEAISFHHTKPWGVGEGGCVIVDRADVPLVRSALNFGMGQPEVLKPFAGNGKISEFACALILDRLERLPAWSSFYIGQRHRLAKLCKEAGLPTLGHRPAGAVIASLPVLAARPIQMADLTGQPFDMGKYYPPLGKGYPKAAHIFSRIVNIPCHSGMAAIPNDVLKAVLRDLATPATPGVLQRAVRRIASLTRSDA